MTGSKTFSKFQEYLLFKEEIDTSVGLWIVNDILDVDALPCNSVDVGRITKEELSYCRDFFTAFPAVFLAIADKEKRERLSDMFGDVLPEVRLLLPADNAFGDHDRIVDVLREGGSKAVDNLLVGYKEKPAMGLLDIADIDPPDWSKRVATLTGFNEIDRATGGFASGELVIWTGRRGSGKSTVLSQLAVEAIDQGLKVFVYSGELQDWRFKEWISLQAAGKGYTYQQEIQGGRAIYKVDKSTQKRIDEWWRGKMLLADNRLNSSNDENTILSLAEQAFIRYGCKMFVFDNLMTVRMSSSNDKDFYRQQSNFVGRLKEFAVKNNVCVHLVAHPRKTDSERSLNADDVGGSADITNKADILMTVERLSEADVERQGYGTVLSIKKNRDAGSYISVGLDFDETCRRFKKHGNNFTKQYGWKAYSKQRNN